MSVRPLLASLAVVACVGSATVAISTPAESVTATTANVATPGVLRGFGFDQCEAPSQHAMNVWLRQSPYLAAGIYIAGNSRGCRDQPNLTPMWVAKQLAHGWHLLPITVGPQAPCNPRFPRYGSDPTIYTKHGSSNRYQKAQAQGTAEAQTSVAAAQALGIVAGSTIYYDLEAFNAGRTGCRTASMAFLSGWTAGLHAAGYVSGVYSSAGSGIWMLDKARIAGSTTFLLPDQIWIARWDGEANTSTSYIANDGWRPGRRLKQYTGGHSEDWGGVGINVDRDFLSLGTRSVPAETRCGGVPVDFRNYPKLEAGASPALVTAMQCLLSEQGVYKGPLNGQLDQPTVAAMNAWQTGHSFPVRSTWSRRNWMSLFAAGDQPVVKFGSTGAAVRDVQRALNAASWTAKLKVTGIFNHKTDVALRTWQIDNRRIASGVANPGTWRAFFTGTRTRPDSRALGRGVPMTFGQERVRVGPREPSWWWHPKPSRRGH